MNDLLNRQKTFSLPDRLKAILKSDDNDRGQAIVRTILSLVAFIYLWYVWSGNTNLKITDQILAVSFSYLIFSLLILASNFAWPGYIKSRRLLCIVTDTLVVTYVLIVGGESGAPLVGGYLWTTIGNGLRFGRKSLYTANILSIIGMLSVLIYSEYWIEHRILGFGLLIWMIILPAYVAKLISKLENALNKAEQASRTKSVFLANMSHELRTPLNAIIGYSELLEEEAIETSNKQVVDDLKKIQGSANHLLQLINEVLDLSKIEAGKMAVHYETFALPPLIEEVKNATEPLMLKNHNTLEIIIENNIDQIYSDVTKLRQILFNLLGNAGKFTKDGMVKLTVAIDQNPRQDEIVFSIEDTGIGMNKQQINKLFDPFVQADESTTRRYGGTGLGLVITKRFCEIMKGTIEISSEPGKGSVFTIRLPLITEKNR